MGNKPNRDCIDYDDDFFSNKKSISNSSSKGKNWVSQLNGNLKISEITWATSHDTMAYQFRPGSAPSKASKNYKAFMALPPIPGVLTQSYTITQQLNMGIRSFDIRCNVFYFEEDKYQTPLYCVHGLFYVRSSLEDVLSSCKTFLDQNPNEVILMNIRKDGGDKRQNQRLNIPELNFSDFQNCLGKYFHKYLDYIYIADDPTRIPRLNDCRKKIIIYYDATSNRNLFHIYYPDNKWHDQDENHNFPPGYIILGTQTFIDKDLSNLPNALMIDALYLRGQKLISRCKYIIKNRSDNLITEISLCNYDYRIINARKSLTIFFPETVSGGIWTNKINRRVKEPSPVLRMLYFTGDDSCNKLNFKGDNEGDGSFDVQDDVKGIKLPPFTIVGTGLNKILGNYILRRKNNLYLGIVNIDFPSPYLISLLIDCNFN
jgi:hypothetical protein